MIRIKGAEKGGYKWPATVRAEEDFSGFEKRVLSERKRGVFFWVEKGLERVNKLEKRFFESFFVEF